jgi:hypothetical protein
MGTSAKPLEYRVQIQCVMLFLCPFCDVIRPYQVHPDLWRFRCKNAECKQVFYWIGPRIAIANGKRPRAPRKVDRVFPAYAVEEYREHKLALELGDPAIQDDPVTEERLSPDPDE